MIAECNARCSSQPGSPAQPRLPEALRLPLASRRLSTRSVSAVPRKPLLRACATRETAAAGHSLAVAAGSRAPSHGCCYTEHSLFDGRGGWAHRVSTFLPHKTIYKLDFKHRDRSFSTTDANNEQPYGLEVRRRARRSARGEAPLGARAARTGPEPRPYDAHRNEHIPSWDRGAAAADRYWGRAAGVHGRIGAAAARKQVRAAAAVRACGMPRRCLYVLCIPCCLLTRSVGGPVGPRAPHVCLGAPQLPRRANLVDASSPRPCRRRRVAAGRVR